LLIDESEVLEKKQMLTETQKLKLELLRNRFLEWLAALNYSPLTLTNYGRDVRRFLDWLETNIQLHSLTDLTAAHLQQYQIAVSQIEIENEKTGTKKRLSIGAQTNKLAALRKFCGWLWQEGYLAYNPASALQLPKAGHQLPKNVLTPAEARRLIEATPTVQPRDIRDRAILETLYSTGLRRAELLALSIYDVDWQSESIRVEHGKGDEMRLVPLTASTKAALKLYLDEVRPRYANKAGQIFLFVSSRSGSQLSGDDIRRIVTKAAKKSQYQKTHHAARHSSQLRDTSVERQSRHSANPKAARSSPFVVNRNLHAC
jgi:integrase/recombinase XerD